MKKVFVRVVLCLKPDVLAHICQGYFPGIGPIVQRPKSM